MYKLQNVASLKAPTVCFVSAFVGYIKEGLIYLILTHLCLASTKWDIGNSIDSDQRPQNAASDQSI